MRKLELSFVELELTKETTIYTIFSGTIE